MSLLTQEMIEYLQALRLDVARDTNGTVLLTGARSGKWVDVHPDFAEAYWADPGLYQRCLDDMAEGKHS